MSTRSLGDSARSVLLAARRIADYAMDEGAAVNRHSARAVCEHMGAVVADSVLQAGLNYSTIVRPRVLNIMNSYPELTTVSSLRALVGRQETHEFLNWRHNEKVTRFENLVEFLWRRGVEYAADLREQLALGEFCEAVQRINGIGPKTVDYMACLVGVESIAIDRHVRAFARSAGVENDDYSFLKNSFCCAADLLELPRREFDAWLWQRASLSRNGMQFGLTI